jgi:hypothetical protein
MTKTIRRKSKNETVKKIKRSEFMHAIFKENISSLENCRFIVFNEEICENKSFIFWEAENCDATKRKMKVETEKCAGTLK